MFLQMEPKNVREHLLHNEQKMFQIKQTLQKEQKMFAMKIAHDFKMGPKTASSDLLWSCMAF